MDKKLTTAFGAPVDDNQNLSTAGERDPAMLQNIWFLEKMAYFDREVISERRMHAKGYNELKSGLDIKPFGRSPHQATVNFVYAALLNLRYPF